MENRFSRLLNPLSSLKNTGIYPLAIRPESVHKGGWNQNRIMAKSSAVAGRARWKQWASSGI